MEPRTITQAEAADLLASGYETGRYEPLGLFLVGEAGGTWTGIDNSTGHAWTEEFGTQAECLKWLKGETPSPSMDILISSNLERLLYDLCGKDDAQIREWFSALAKEGRYSVTPEVLSKLRAGFYGGYCTDEETLSTIGKVFREYGYLSDTHTAVGYHVLEGYRAQTGDDAPAILASTASPFKFCDSVLTALGQTKLAQGLDLIDQLEQVSGVKAPQPLASLRGKAVRFDQVTEKEDMQSVVRAMLR